MADIAELTRIIEPEVQAEGLALVRVMMIGGKDDPTLQVMAERPDTRQLDLADCERLSRRLSDALDALEARGEDPIEGGYRLEVSSPGIDRPLTRMKDFDDWAGHEARLNLTEKIEGRKQYSGDLIGADGEEVLIRVDGLGERRVPFAAVHSAKLLFTDRLLAATAPISADGADTIEQTEEEGQD
ncbi:ribosome maturation protein RimP [Sphingosinicella sp. LHD-64]|uniref:ribosome maturation protein RimP n=1 Tax=Sphingosinicella sp. LHD-64 TaxID=3072139 RepID=UPI00280EC74F|nr:ribosome maturation protein RimP [Sphingosinicella sp. LHD-64]MDQ8756026.1 ribosome maturation protein RimP [Sphingosinicella sp. LHD-64]